MVPWIGKVLGVADNINRYKKLAGDEFCLGMNISTKLVFKIKLPVSYLLEGPGRISFLRLIHLLVDRNNSRKSSKSDKYGEGVSQNTFEKVFDSQDCGPLARVDLNAINCEA